MATQLSKMSNEFLMLGEMVGLLEAIEDQETSICMGDEEKGAIMETMLDRMSDLSRSIAQTHVHTPQELAQKARVVLDWVNADGDLADALSASLCHDVVTLFSEHAESSASTLSTAARGNHETAVSRAAHLNARD